MLDSMSNTTCNRATYCRRLVVGYCANLFTTPLNYLESLYINVYCTHLLSPFNVPSYSTLLLSLE